MEQPRLQCLELRLGQRSGLPQLVEPRQFVEGFLVPVRVTSGSVVEATVLSNGHHQSLNVRGSPLRSSGAPLDGITDRSASSRTYDIAHHGGRTHDR
jgi:hypothetical protein